MNLIDWWTSLPPERKVRVARRARTSKRYLAEIVYGRARAGEELARRLAKADPKLPLKVIRPDIWGNAPYRPCPRTLASRA